MKKYFLLIVMVRLDWGKISLKTWNGIDMEVKNNEFRNGTITLWRYEI